MKVETQLARTLSAQETDALRAYGSDSTYFHAISQYRSEDLQYDLNFQKMILGYSALAKSIDSAIAESFLKTEAVLYSAHGTGFGIRGSLEGPANNFVGLIYRYPGYISTSTSYEFCQHFLEPRKRTGSRPTMVEFQMPAGSNAIDMAHGGHSGEFEFLLPRNIPFNIVDASSVDDVLYLTMRPST